MRTYAQDLRVHAYAYMGMRAHAKAPKTIKGKFSAFKTWFRNESHIVWEPFQTPPPHFFTIKSHTWYFFKQHKTS